MYTHTHTHIHFKKQGASTPSLHRDHTIENFYSDKRNGIKKSPTRNPGKNLFSEMKDESIIRSSIIQKQN